jgi:D-alanyl-D-alanine carboxypeptidase
VVPEREFRRRDRLTICGINHRMRVHTTLCFLIALLTSPAQAQVPPDVQQEIERRATADEFSGAVLIAKDGKAIFEGAYGNANRERKTKNTLDTRFRFGSMGKMFTAVAALQLVQSGKLELAAPLGKYLPDYPNKEVAAVTIEQLLTHTGGTGDIFSPEYFDHRDQVRTHEDYLKLFGGRGVRNTPDARWDYSNYGMILLGRVIEVASGQSYYDYTRTHVFEPLGMNGTGNEPEGTHVPQLSTGYTHMGARPGPPGPLRANTDTLPYRGTAAGGGYSTVGDLLKFGNGLTTHRLLDAAHTEMLFKPRVRTARDGREQALGLSVRTLPDGSSIVGHGGGAPGMNGELMYLPKSGYLVVVLANLDPPVATEIADFITEHLPAARK